MERLPMLYKPSLCMVVQGSKQATLEGQRYRYDPGHYLVVGVPLPVQAEILEASPERPFLSLVLELQSSVTTDLLLQLEGAEIDRGAQAEPVGTAIAVSRLDAELADAVVRLLRAVQRPADRATLVPLIVREIHYRVLQGEQGRILRALAFRDSGSHQVARVIRYLEAHHPSPLDVSTIAAAHGMSSSTLHHTFKAVTAHSPIQYLKRIRLHRARELMLQEGCGAAEAAHRVGYGSPSHFSREFRRMFGASPSEEVSRWREEARAGGA
jgi:AraC-like DNA-binding protein